MNPPLALLNVSPPKSSWSAELKELMSEVEDDRGVVYEVMRCELMQVLMQHHSQGRFAKAADDTDFLADLMRSIVDILVAACPKQDPSAHVAVLVDAQTIANTVFARGLPTTR